MHYSEMVEFVRSHNIQRSDDWDRPEVVEALQALGYDRWALYESAKGQITAGVTDPVVYDYLISEIRETLHV